MRNLIRPCPDYSLLFLLLVLTVFVSPVNAQIVKNDSLESGNSIAAVNSPAITIAAFTSIDTHNRLSVNPFISGSVGGFYFENRYNYEAANSASINMGKKINKNIAGFVVTPMIGVVTGNFKGINTEIQAYHDAHDWYFSLDNQYVIAYQAIKRSFNYDWLVGRFKLTKFFAIGLTGQITKPANQRGVFDRGITTSIHYGNFAINVYAYNYEAHRKSSFISLRYNLKIYK